MKSVILDAAGDGETAPFRWWPYVHRVEWPSLLFGTHASWTLGGRIEIGLGLGWWVVGIDRTREED